MKMSISTIADNSAESVSVVDAAVLDVQFSVQAGGGGGGGTTEPIGISPAITLPDSATSKRSVDRLFLMGDSSQNDS